MELGKNKKRIIEERRKFKEEMRNEIEIELM